MHEEAPGRWIYAPTLVEIEDAARALAGVGVTTPLLENLELNKTCHGRLLVKAEGMQRTGSFKFRGAYNRIRQLDESERRRAVIAYSSGNHAQAVACAALACSDPELAGMSK